MFSFSPLGSFRIVLVETTLPANIGSVARAMKTMGFSKLHVVNPKHPLDTDAQSRAAGATDILEQIVYHYDLTNAIADSHIVWAASGRQRSLPIPALSLKQACDSLNAYRLETSNGDEQAKMPQISIIFGREDRGLTNYELSQAHLHVFIPANPDYGVLNLAAAVQVFCYEVRQALINNDKQNQSDLLNNTVAHKVNKNNNYIETTIRSQWDEVPATLKQIQQLEATMLQLAELIELYDTAQPRKTPQRVKRLLRRTQLDRMEYNFLRALITKSIKKIMS